MKDNQRKFIYTAMFAAVVVVLQMFVSIPVGVFTITLTLVPIMLGAILFGPLSGAVLGGVFGVVVAIQVAQFHICLTALQWCYTQLMHHMTEMNIGMSQK